MTETNFLVQSLLLSNDQLFPRDTHELGKFLCQMKPIFSIDIFENTRHLNQILMSHSNHSTDGRTLAQQQQPPPTPSYSRPEQSRTPFLRRNVLPRSGGLLLLLLLLLLVDLPENEVAAGSDTISFSLYRLGGDFLGKMATGLTEGKKGRKEGRS